MRTIFTTTLALLLFFFTGVPDAPATDKEAAGAGRKLVLSVTPWGSVKVIEKVYAP